MLALSPKVSISEESWARIWPEARELAAAHSAEVDVEPRRRWDPDTELLAALNLQGSFRLWGARDTAGGLVGYITWTLSPDPESRGLLTALMGPWYAAPGSRCGGKLFDSSLARLKELGVRCVYPHHHLQGRGAELGAFFKLRGAQLFRHEYVLWIGE